MTFSVDLTMASAGEWFLNGQSLKASNVYMIRRDGTRHTVTIRSVPASLHGAELKFVANGIESSIRMEVRGRGTPASDPQASPSSVFSGGWGQGEIVVPRPQCSWRVQVCCWAWGPSEWGPIVERVCQAACPGWWKPQPKNVSGQGAGPHPPMMQSLCLHLPPLPSAYSPFPSFLIASPGWHLVLSSFLALPV